MDWDPEMKPEAIVFLIRLPDCSVNRSKYSLPMDVLVNKGDDDTEQCVISWLVGDVPTQLPAKEPSGLAYDCRVVHDPLEDNYSHTEIRTYPTGTSEVKEPSKTQKRFLREKIAEVATILFKE